MIIYRVEYSPQDYAPYHKEVGYFSTFELAHSEIPKSFKLVSTYDDGYWRYENAKRRNESWAIIKIKVKEVSRE